jgi:hypothetical protein
MQAMKELKRGGRSYCAVETVSGGVNARKTKLRPDVRARVVSEGEGRKEGTDSVRSRDGPWAIFGVGPERVPEVQFSFLFCFLLFLFLFLFSSLFYRFCMLNPNQAKPIS